MYIRDLITKKRKKQELDNEEIYANTISKMIASINRIKRYNI